jgi:hypothetical protein
MAVEPVTCPAEAEEQDGRLVLGVSIPFDEIDEPGAYVCNWSGHLLRVRGDALDHRHEGSVNLVGSEPLLVTKISDNPFIATHRARSIASQLALAVNF